MSDVTVTLTEQESAFIKYVLNANADTIVSDYNRLKTLALNNGSFEGTFGEAVENADKALLSALLDHADVYEVLARKF